MRMQSCRTKSRNSCILLAKNPMAPPSLPQVPLPLPPPCLLLLFPSPSPSPTAAPPLPHPPFACTLILCIRLYKRARRGRHARRTHARTQARRNTRARGAAGGGGGGGAGAQPRGDGSRRLTPPPPARRIGPGRRSGPDSIGTRPPNPPRPTRPAESQARQPAGRPGVRLWSCGAVGVRVGPVSSGPCGAAAGVRGPGPGPGPGADPARAELVEGSSEGCRLIAGMLAEFSHRFRAATVNVRVLGVLMYRSACSLWYP